MQRIETLIEKLWDQYTAKAPAAEMLVTVQMLQQELTGAARETSVLGAAKISVFVPHLPVLAPLPPGKETTEAEPDKLYFELQVPEEELLKDEDEVLGAAPQNNTYKKSIDKDVKVVENEDIEIHKAEIPTVGRKLQGSFDFESTGLQGPEILQEIPTFSQQIIDYTPSINDEQASKQQLQPEKTEKISDLKSAVSINDRFMFISELFRDDEDGYERSLKTIDKFANYAEAEFWIKRELKTKLGWPAKGAAVELFDALIKRRFS